MNKADAINHPLFNIYTSSPATIKEEVIDFENWLESYFNYSAIDYIYLELKIHRFNQLFPKNISLQDWLLKNGYIEIVHYYEYAFEKSVKLEQLFNQPRLQLTNIA